MASAAEINARCDRLSDADKAVFSKSYHGIAARLDRLPVGTWQRRIVFIFGGAIFCDCLDQYVGGGIIAHLLKDGWSTAELNASFISMTMLGYLIGALMSGYLADHFGRRKGLLINILIFIIATFAAAFVPSMEALIACRFVMGIGLGAALPGSYGALGEFTPPQVRGKYAGYIGLIGNFSPPAGALCTMLLLPLVGWRPIFIGIAILSVFVWVIMFKFMPESPRWLASQGRNEEADVIVCAAEKSFTDKGIELEPINYDEIKDKKQDEETKQLPWSALFRKNAIRRTATICCALFAMNVAIYTISGWTPSIFVLKGMDVSLSIGITVVMLVGAPVGIFILSMLADKFNRKPALVVTLIATAICGYLWSLIPVENTGLIMGVGFVLCALVYYYALLACSVYIGEIFPTELRIRGAGFANAVGRVGAVLSPYWVAALLQSAGVDAVYFVNGAICIVVAIILGIFGIETRNKSLEEINDKIVEED